MRCAKNKQYSKQSQPSVPKPVKKSHTLKTHTQALFLNTLPVPAADPAAAVFGAGAFFVVPPVTPFLMVPMTVRLGCVTGGFGCAPGGAVMGRFLITVEVLPSLDSLVPLVLRVVRVAGLGAGFAAAVVTVAALFLLAAAAAVVVVPVPVVVLLLVVVVVELLDVVDVIVLRAAMDVGGRVVDREPSTILLRMLLAAAALPGVAAGRAMPDLPGVATVRGAVRELVVVGESACAGFRAALGGACGRNFFSGVCVSFSLSPPDISWLFHVLVHRIFCSRSARLTSVSCLAPAR